MDRAWVDQVVAALGPRYRAGKPAGDGVELQRRSGRTEFHPCRFVLGLGGSGRELELEVDVRVPRGYSDADADALLGVFEARTATPRGFVRGAESVTQMRSDLGADAGTVRSLRYRCPALAPGEAAKQIRAIAESVDIPIVLGIHEAEHLVARDPAPPPPRPRGPAAEPLDLWEYQLDGGLTRSLTVVVDPNDRTLRVVERHLFTKKALGEKLKLAHVARFGLRRTPGAAALVAVKRDGSELTLATGSGSAEFVATAARLAKKVLIPIAELPAP